MGRLGTTVIVIGAFVIAVIMPMNNVQAREISLDGFIAETIRNNPTVRAFIKHYAEAKGSEFAARGIDDVQFESLFAMARRENPTLAPFQSTQDDMIGYEIGVSKIVSASGTRFSAKWSDAWSNSDYPPLSNVIIQAGLQNPPNTLYHPAITLQLTQPLLKNILGIQDRLNLDLARIQLAAADLSYQENIESFISQMADMYLRWRFAYDNAATLERVYRKVGEQEKLVREEVEAKVAEESDLYRAMEQRAFYKAQWEGYLALFESLTREVAAMMRPRNPDFDITPTSTDASFIGTVPDKRMGMDYLKTASRLKGILDLSLESQNTTLAANKNARMPDMNLYVGYRRHAAASTFGTAHGSAFNNDDIGGGLKFSVPLTNRAARGTYRTQQAKTRRVEFENERVMLDATSKLDGLYEQKGRLEQQVKAFEQQWEYGKKKLDEEIEQYNDGRLTLFQLLQDTSTHIGNRIRLEEARYNLARTRLVISELTDSSLDAFRGAINDVLDEEDADTQPASTDVTQENIE